MASDRANKTDKKAKRERKLALEHKANGRVAEAEAVPGKHSSSQKQNEDQDARSPPLPLLDLIHNFLRDSKYTKAAHIFGNDNKTSPEQNVKSWKSTSAGYPNLIEIFSQWEEQNRGRIQEKSQSVDKISKRTQDVAPGVSGTVPEQEPKKAHKNKSKKASKEASPSELSSSGSESDSDSDSLSDSDSASDSESSVSDHVVFDRNSLQVKGTKPAEIATKNLKRKAAEMLSSDSSSGDDSEDTSSASDSGESSDSSAESEVEAAQPKKRRKLDNAGADVLKATKKRAREDSSSSSDSASDSDGSSRKQDTAHIGLTNQPNSSGSESESDNDSDSSSSSDSSSDSEAGGIQLETGKLASVKQTLTPNGSDTSATLQYPSEIASAIPAKAPYSTSGSSSDSATEPATPTAHTNGEIHPDRMSRVNGSQQLSKPDVLIFKDPNASNPTETRTLPATAQNMSKLRKQAVPFSRIPDNVKVDERFSSNKYIPYDYANKAHEDLIVTKGKGFTKEKNKKKRGSYRGGLIDMAPKGIKFDD